MKNSYILCMRDDFSWLFVIIICRAHLGPQEVLVRLEKRVPLVPMEILVVLGLLVQLEVK